MAFMQDYSRQRIFTRHVAAAGAAIAVESALACPFDMVKSLEQVTAGAHSKTAISSVISRAWPFSSLSGLYSGMGWMSLGRIPALGSRYGTYEILTAFFKDGREENYVYASEAFMAGVASGIIESVMVTPFDLFKVRSQVASVASPRQNVPLARIPPTVSTLLPGYSPNKMKWDRVSQLLSALPSKSSNIISIMQDYPWLMTGSGHPPLATEVKTPKASISLEGWQVLWRGLRSGLFRDATYGGVFFSCWQALHDLVIDWKGFHMNPPPTSLEEIGPLSPMELSVTAAVSGSVAAIASHPFDTVKTRSQCLVIPKYIAMERKCYKWKTAGSWFQRISGINPWDKGRLFHGLWMRAAQSAISSFVLVGAYHTVVSHLLK